PAAEFGIRSAIARLLLRWRLSKARVWIDGMMWARAVSGTVGVAYWEKGTLRGHLLTRPAEEPESLCIFSDEEPVYEFHPSSSVSEEPSVTLFSNTSLPFRSSPPWAIRKYLARSAEVSVRSASGVLAVGVISDQRESVS